MSIFNSLAALISNGASYENGTFVPASQWNPITISYYNTHTTAPDITLFYTDANNLSATGDLAFRIQVNGTNSLATNWCDWNTTGAGMFAEILKNTSYYIAQPIDSSDISTYFPTSQFYAYPYDGSFNTSATYDWWAIWLDGSGGGGGGGSSMNVQTNQTTSRTSATTLTSVNSLTCTTAGTYDVYWTCDRSSTSGTWSSQLYVNGTASGSEQTTWSNHVQTVHLTGVTIGANQTVAVYVKARGTNYYGYAPQLTIIQTS